jgi:hypothetical protein
MNAFQVASPVAEEGGFAMAKLSTACGIALVASVAWAMAGCGSTTLSSPGTAKTVYASDLAMLAGTWQGTGKGATGDTMAATLRVNPDGTYSLQMGAWSAQGKAQVVDGALVFAATGGGTGRGEGAAAVGERTGTAVVMDEGDNWALIGSGRASTGPYNFAFRKPKS